MSTTWTIEEPQEPKKTGQRSSRAAADYGGKPQSTMELCPGCAHWTGDHCMAPDGVTYTSVDGALCCNRRMATERMPCPKCAELQVKFEAADAIAIARARSLALAQKQNEEATARAESLRATLIGVGRAMGAGLSDRVSDDFLRGLVGEATVCRTKWEMNAARAEQAVTLMHSTCRAANDRAEAAERTAEERRERAKAAERSLAEAQARADHEHELWGIVEVNCTKLARERDDARKALEAYRAFVSAVERFAPCAGGDLGIALKRLYIALPTATPAKMCESTDPYCEGCGNPTVRRSSEGKPQCSWCADTSLGKPPAAEPGVCHHGLCHCGLPQPHPASVERVVEAAKGLLPFFGSESMPLEGARGIRSHGHTKPGIWDDDNNPEIRGQACKQCAAVGEFHAAIRALSQPGEQRSVQRWAAFDPRDPDQWPRVLHDENPLGDRVPVTVSWQQPCAKEGGEGK